MAIVAQSQGSVWSGADAGRRRSGRVAGYGIMNRGGGRWCGGGVMVVASCRMGGGVGG